MSHGSLLILLVTLAASSASAQYDEEALPLELKGSGRFSLQTGWRYTPNTGFYDGYYSQVENRDLSRASGSIGGPLLTATFAYSFTNLIELGIDLFTTYERMRLTDQPGLYRQGRSWLYVSRGVGTTGPPVRLGAPPELAVITLRRA